MSEGMLWLLCGSMSRGLLGSNKAVSGVGAMALAKVWI